MLIVGIDPSTKMPAWAKATEKKVFSWGKLTLYPLDKWQKLIKGADLLAIESQYLGKSVSSLIKLAWATGELMACAKLLGVEVKVVPPSVWQRAMLKLRHDYKRRVNKRLSKATASALVGQKISDDNIADAILITEYIRQKEVMNG